MHAHSTAQAGLENARPQLGPVSCAIAAMRSHDAEREAFRELRAALLERIAGDLARLDQLEELAERLQIGGRA